MKTKNVQYQSTSFTSLKYIDPKIGRNLGSKFIQHLNEITPAINKESGKDLDVGLFYKTDLFGNDRIKIIVGEIKESKFLGIIPFIKKFAYSTGTVCNPVIRDFLGQGSAVLEETLPEVKKVIKEAKDIIAESKLLNKITGFKK